MVSPLLLPTPSLLLNKEIMKSKRLIIFIFCITTLVAPKVYAQVFTAGDQITLNISEYALIDSNHAPVVLTMESTEAGAPVTSVSNSDLFIKISSIVPGGTDRELTARISSGTVPAGTTLTLISANCTTTNSGGALGTALSPAITLSSVDQYLVRYIGTCYTGTGNNDGYQMTFTWSPIDLTTNYSLISSDSYNITVVFTLTAHDGN